MTVKFQVRMAGPKTGELYLYDSIGEGFFGGGISARQVVDELKALGKVDKILVRINSEGGSVFDGFAIFNALDRHPARIEVDVDGMALSIASVIAMAGDEVRIAANGMMMVHDPHTMAHGSADEFRKQADLMDAVKANIADTYARRSGKPAAAVADLMSAETWFTAAQAVDFGLADKVTEPLKMAASFDVSKFKNAPRALLEKSRGQPPANVFRSRLAAMHTRANDYGRRP